MDIDFTKFMAFCKELEGKTLTTLTHKAKFDLVEVDSTTLWFLPKKGSQSRRKTKGKETLLILTRFAARESYKPFDYIDLTINASYMLKLIWLFVKKEEIVYKNLIAEMQ